MRDLLVTVVAFVVAIGVLIAVHEAGHFWLARRLGFKVLRFSIGFGRTLWSRTGRDGVEYVLAVLPIGGYVKMADEREGPVAEADQPKAFNRRPVWQRIVVLLGGPAANLLFAVLAFWIVFMSGVPGAKPMVDLVSPGSIAALAGVKPGELIVRVGSEAVATQEATVLAMVVAVVRDGRVELDLAGPGGTHHATLTVSEQERRALTEPGAWVRGFGFSFPKPHIAAVIGPVDKDGSAARAGLEKGDLVLAVDGHAVSEWVELVDLIRAKAGATLALRVRRASGELTIPVEVRGELDKAHPTAPPIGRIGVGIGAEPQWPPGIATFERYGPVAAFRNAVHETWSKSAVTVTFLAHMVTGEVSLKNVSGPLSIANYAGISALEGGTYYLAFIAIISISLAILNLLPIPILDGGQIVYQLAEAVKGSPLSLRAQLLGQQVGIVMLLLLMSLAFYNDFARHFG
jgi:regulator of sigma E protease